MIGGPYFLGFVSFFGFVCALLTAILSIYGIKHSRDGLKRKIPGMRHLLIGFSFMFISQAMVFYIFTPFAHFLHIPPKKGIMVVVFYSIRAFPLIAFGVSIIFISLGLIKMADAFFRIKYAYYRITVANERRKMSDNTTMFKEDGEKCK